MSSASRNTNDAKRDAENSTTHYELLSKQTVVADSDDRQRDIGCGSRKPTILQRIAGPKLFTIHAGCMLAVQYGMGAYVSGILTTIERQFELSSSEAAGLTVINDVASLCLILFASYYGHTSHRPRWVAGGGLIIALGLLLCTVPHFISDPIDPLSIIVGGSRSGIYSKGAPGSGVCNAHRGDSPNQITDVLYYQNSTNQSVSSDFAEPFRRYNVTLTNDCEGITPHGLGLVKWLVAGQIIVGCGTAPVYPLLISYIDDSVRKHELTSYTAVLFISATLGLMAGLMLSSKATSLYVDFDRVDPIHIPDIPQYDPRWIGAWWLGFLVGTTLLVILAIPMCFYPKRMDISDATIKTVTKNGTPADEDDNMNKMTGVFINQSENKGLKDGIKGIMLTVRRLLLNVTLLWMILGVSAEMSASIIGRTFGVKYLQTQFGMSPREATMLTGGILVPSVVAGLVVSAFICRRFKFDIKEAVIFVLISVVLSSLTVPMKMFIGCQNSMIAGVNVPYPESRPTIAATTAAFSVVLGSSTVPMKMFIGCQNSLIVGVNIPYPESRPTIAATTAVFSNADITDYKQSSLESACNVDCGCRAEIFRPVCGADGVTYISPCHAGCLILNLTAATNASTNRSTKTYSHCKCVAANGEGYASDTADSAVSGQCRHNCDSTRKMIYLALGAFSVFFMALVFNPLTVINLRIVDPNDRSVAIGLRSLINKCLGFFPAPVYMGAIINSTCIHWQHTCGKRGACWLYDIVAYRYAFFGAITVLEVIGLICYIAMYLSIKRNMTAGTQKLPEESPESSELTKFEMTSDLNTKYITNKVVE